MSAMRFAPTFQFDFPHVRLTAHGAALLSEQNLQIADGIVSGTFTSPTVYGVRAEMIGNASRAVDQRSLGSDQVDVQTRIHVPFRQAGGMWFGGGVAKPWRVAVISSADVLDGGVWGRLGDAAAKFGIATLTATFTNFSFSKVASVQDSNSVLSCGVAAATNLPASAALADDTGGGTCERQSRFSDLEAVLQWEVGPLELSAQSGYRLGDSYDVTPDTRQWTSGRATIWLNERIAIIGGGGRQPALPLRGLPARNFGMAGLVIAYSPVSKSTVPVSMPHAVLVKKFEMQPGTGDMRKIVIRVGGVERVDVMGDFSDWSPLTLVRRGRDLWELNVPVSPGVHHINVRVDGGPWMAPPGVPTMHDPYSGDVGLIVIPR
jgi:hypothetical protein